MIYLTIAVLIALSAFFSGTEIAFTSASKLRLEKAMEEGKKGAALAYWIYNKYDRAITTILLGNNLVNVAASALATVVFMQIIADDDLASVVATIVMTVLVLIFGESIPKMIAKKIPAPFAQVAALPLRILMFVTLPLVWPVTALAHAIASKSKGAQDEGGVTEDELASIIETVEDEGVIDEEQGELLQNALDFDDTTAQEIMTPRVDMIAVDCEDSLEEILTICEENNFTRMPVYQDSIDNIIGILHVNHLYKAIAQNKDVKITDVLLDTCYVYKTMTLPAIMTTLKKHKTHMAIVTDDFGGTMGVLTMEDVLEELVGEIWDETDEVEEDFTNLSQDTFDVSGDMNIDDFIEAMELNESLVETDSTTVGGWVLEMFNGFPENGESFEFENLKVIVEEIDNRRIERIRVERLEKVEEE
ncbi:MAG: HlyC/CorC family transporter [Clostridia bacterium]|nr:HlyC/CorC family transporter [Clostridia bacterium]